MRSKRRSYDTKVKYLAKVNLLPDSIYSQINPSLIWKWKQESSNKYFGHELTIDLDKHYKVLKEFSEHKNAQKVFIAYVRLFKTLHYILVSSNNFHRVIQASKESVVEVIQRVSLVLSIEKAVKIFNISVSTYYAWLLNSKSKCFESFFMICNRVYSQQLTRVEIHKIKNLLLDPRFIHWPVSSIAHYAARNNILHLNVNTWYKYSKLLQLKRIIPLSRRKKATIGIRASMPNEKWHADVTRFVTQSNISYYIYLVTDNYSRFILSWRISNKLCATTRLETFREAFSISSARYPDSSISLIVDGGSENNNQLVNEYIEQLPSVKKLVIFKDIHFSNSLAEAINKIIKYRYLYTKPVLTYHELNECMEKAIHDYNNLRPHVSLNGLTPYEAFSGIKPDIEHYTKQKQLAIINRMGWNRKYTCKLCN